MTAVAAAPQTQFVTAAVAQQATMRPVPPLLATATGTRTTTAVIAPDQPAAAAVSAVIGQVVGTSPMVMAQRSAQAAVPTVTQIRIQPQPPAANALQRRGLALTVSRL